MSAPLAGIRAFSADNIEVAAALVLLDAPITRRKALANATGQGLSCQRDD